MSIQNAGAGKKILVTGGTGFLGAYIIKELIEKNYTVRAIRRSDKLPFFIPKSILDKVEWINGDILDTVGLEEAMLTVDAVIHAAAKVSFIPAERKEMFHTNIDGTMNVVNAALAQNIQRVIHVSSVASLGRKEDSATINEGEQWDENKLTSDYAVSKYHAEMEVWRAIGEGLNATIINPSTIIGYGDWNTTSCAIFKNVYKGFPWYSNGVNGFVDVKDVARVAVLLLESGSSGQRFVVSGDNWSFRQLFNTIADGFSKKHPGREATPFLSSIAWRLEKIKSLLTGKASLLTKQSAKIALGKVYFDNSKIRQFLPGFSFTSLNQSVNEACKAYLASIQPL